MSGRNARYLSAFRGLALSFIALASVAIAVTVWNEGAEFARLRERAYPIPDTRCEKSKTCEERALQIEARDATTSDAALDVALGQLVASILGIAGVGCTVFYARLAWKEAQRSADAATTALDQTKADAAEQAERFTLQLQVASSAADAATRQAIISEDTARKHLKAYLYAQSITISWATDGFPLFTLTLRNTGLTPATNVRAGGCVEFGDFGLLPSVPPDLRLARETLIGAGIEKPTTLYVQGDKSARASSVSSTNLMYVLGRIEYEDVFGIRYETEFAFFTGIPSPPGGMSIMSGHRASFREIPKEG